MFEDIFGGEFETLCSEAQRNTIIEPPEGIHQVQVVSAQWRETRSGAQAYFVTMASPEYRFSIVYNVAHASQSVARMSKADLALLGKITGLGPKIANPDAIDAAGGMDVSVRVTITQDDFGNDRRRYRVLPPLPKGTATVAQQSVSAKPKAKPAPKQDAGRDDDIPW